MLRTSLAAIAVLSALSLAACGGDDTAEGDASDTPTSAAPTTTDAGSEEPPAETEEPADGISKDDFVEQANAICAEGNAAIEAAGSSVDPEDPESISTYVVDELVPNIRGQLEDIRALGFPSGDEALIGGTLDAADAVLDQVEANPELVTDDTLFAAVNATLNSYGLTDCGAS